MLGKFPKVAQVLNNPVEILLRSTCVCFSICVVRLFSRSPGFPDSWKERRQKGSQRKQLRIGAVTSGSTSKAMPRQVFLKIKY